MFKTVCSNCGRECEVPFRPSNFDQNKKQFEAINVKLDKIVELLSSTVQTSQPEAEEPKKEDKSKKEEKPAEKKNAKKKTSSKK